MGQLAKGELIERRDCPILGTIYRVSTSELLFSLRDTRYSILDTKYYTKRFPLY